MRAINLSNLRGIPAGRRLLLLIIVLGSMPMTGCSSFILGLHDSKKSDAGFVAAYLTPAHSKLPVDATKSTIRDFKNAAYEFATDLEKGETFFNRLDWGTIDVASAGAIVTLAGVARPHHRIALRNVGIGLTVLALAIDKYLTFNERRAAFDAAHAQARCVEDAVGEIPDDAESKAAKVASINITSLVADPVVYSAVIRAKAAAQEAPATWRNAVIQTMNKISLVLHDALEGKRPSAISFADVLTSYAALKAKVPSDSGAAKLQENAASDEEIMALENAKLLNDLPGKVALCVAAK